jgi:hypothetical protein
MKKIFFLITLQFPLLLFSQKDTEFINWNESNKLIWDDFKAAPQKNGDVAALTATHLGFSYTMVNGKISYNIECRFEKNRSWGLVKNDWILQHEQGHFDIAEIFARKLFKAISEYSFNRNSFQQDLNSIYKNIVAEKEKSQLEYDAETDFSRNKNSQEKWVKKIEGELIQFKSWAGYRQ